MCTLYKVEGLNLGWERCSTVPNEEIGTNMQQACENDFENDAFILAQAAQIVRRDMMATPHQFNGSFRTNCQIENLRLNFYKHWLQCFVMVQTFQNSHFLHLLKLT